MRIYFIGQKGIPTLAGGIEKHVESLAVRLAASGHDVFVYTRPHYTAPDLKEYKGVHLISLPSFNRKNLDAISHTILCSFHVLFQKADIIHYHGIGPSLMLWLPKIFKRNTKVIATVHSDDRQHQKWSKFAKFMLGLGARMACRLPDATIAVSKSQKNDFEQEFGGKLTYIPNGVTIYPPFPPDVITKRYGLKGQDYILFVSRFVKHKGLHYLIEAYRNLPNHLSPTHDSGVAKKKLVIVGGSAHTGDYTKTIKEMAAGDPNIMFTGEIKGLPLFELFSNAYLYVIPSEYEGFSTTLIEAMSYGTAILASDIEPNLEALGGLGITFKNKDVDDLQLKLGDLLEYPAKVEASRQVLRDRVKREYDWDVIARETLDLYKRVVGK